MDRSGLAHCRLELTDDEEPPAERAAGHGSGAAAREDIRAAVGTARWAPVGQTSKAPSSSRSLIVMRNRAASAPSTIRWS